jgi:hypothetical protein
MTKGETINVTFKFERETKGAVRYQELNAKGEPVSGDDAYVGTLYFRKAKLNGLKPDTFVAQFTAK